jgi:hypothetical protein
VTVTLWVDDLVSFARMAPTLSVSCADAACADGMCVCATGKAMRLPSLSLANLVIEGFGCPLPPGFLQAMATRTATGAGLAESGISQRRRLGRGLSRPARRIHPQTGLLSQHFWFPGFTGHRLGDLLREHGAAHGLATSFSLTQVCTTSRLLAPVSGCPRRCLPVRLSYSLFLPTRIRAISRVAGGARADRNEPSLVNCGGSGRAGTWPMYSDGPGRNGLQPGDQW